MLYSEKCQVARELFSCVNEDVLTRTVIERLVGSIPVDDLKKIFKVVIIDPETEENLNIVKFRGPTEAYRNFLVSLANDQCLQIEASINI